MSWLKRLRARRGEHGAYPPGHYYSPIPARDEVAAYVAARAAPPAELPGIELDLPRQRELVLEFARWYGELPFGEQPTPGVRYHYDNAWFGHADAIWLYGFIRTFQPRRIVEVGSGFSSAVMLDTVERFCPQAPRITFVEPYPDRLLGLLRDDDRRRVELLQTPVQRVPPATFDALEAGDLLFVDSSHVVKCGSDLQTLLFGVLPRLKPGVFVHFHDVFYPFDYPDEWLLEGRYWNENYFLRAFLSWNAEWCIRLFGSYLHVACPELLAEALPLAARNPGGSLYLQRRPAR